MNKKKMPETTVIENGVYKLLLNLKPRKAALCCLLQVVTRELAPALTLLFYSSIATGQAPPPPNSGNMHWSNPSTRRET